MSSREEAVVAGGAGAPKAGMPPHLMLVRLLGGFRVSRILDTLVELDVAERVASAPKSAAELAAETGVHARSLHRALRAVAAFGIFAEDEHGRFGLTPDAELLRKGARGSVHPSVQVFGQAWHWNMWGGLMDTVRTGKPAFIAQTGDDFEARCARDTALAEAVAESKAAMYEPSDDAIVATYDFSRARQIVDVGGGCGALLARILRTNPTSRGVVFDRPYGLGAARRHIASQALSGRCEVVAGDWFEGFPSGDVTLLRGLLHYFGDDDATRILASCRRAARPTDRLLVAEMLMRPGNDPFVGKFIDVESMLLTAEGRERSEDEYRRLLEQSGFRVTRVINTVAPISVIEAVPVPGAEVS